MAQGRFQASYLPTGALARDATVNTFYLDTDFDGSINTDWDALTQDAAQLFATYRQYPLPGEVTVKCYRMSDALPREPVSTKKATVTQVATGGAGPREVAYCLSFYADRNTPRRRGRLYLGPFSKSEMSERPSFGNDALHPCRKLANGLSGLGGVNVQWVQHSEATGEFHNVTNWWFDDEWDTQRSRGYRATTRSTGTVSG